MSGRLYVVGTPIGNLEDFSPRALRILNEVDFIAAEDTRVTMKLLHHFELKKEMLSYYEHNKSERGNLIIERLCSGENCALVSDAGMPAISDPGEDLVRQARQAGIAVEAVPGPSALITALAISGMPSGRFCFEGFLSVNKISRRQHLQELQREKRTMIFYEAPHKLIATLHDMLEAFGDRELAVARELTKLHETLFHTTLSEALAFYQQQPPRGEFVLILRGCPDQIDEAYTIESALVLAKKRMEDGLSASAAAKEAAAITGVKKGELYKALIFQEKENERI